MPQTIRTFQLTDAQERIIRQTVGSGFSAYIRNLIKQDMESNGITWPDNNRSVGRQPKQEQQS